MLFGKSFENISVVHVMSLIENRVGEKHNLEYKSEVWGRSDSNIREMLKDISAMANAFGGYILIGIQEDNNGLPGDEIRWLTDEEAEMQRGRIINCCISSIEPRIPGLKVATIQEEGHGSLIKIFIPRSTRRPHLVLRDVNRFYIRHDRQVSLMSIEEIREACLRTENLLQNANDFVQHRQTDLKNLVQDVTTLVIGTVPLTVGTDFIDIDNQSIRSFLQNPQGQYCADFDMNFREMRPSPSLSGLSIGTPNYKLVTLMRNGYYELLVPMNGPHYLAQVCEQESYVIKHLPLIKHIVNYFRCVKILKQLIGIEEELIRYLCIYNINKHGFVSHLNADFAPFAGDVRRYSHQDLLIDPQSLYDLENPDSIAKSILGRIWNAFKCEATEVPYFDDDIFVPPTRN